MTGRRFVLWSTAIALLVGGALIVPAEGSDESGASADVTYEYDWATGNAHRRSDGNHAKAWAEDHFDIKVNWIGTDNQVEKLNVLLAAGDIPDLLTVGMDIGGLATYVDQGVLAELPRSMIEEHMPGYMDTYLGGFDAPDLWSFSEFDGRNMGLPLLHPGGIARRAIAWNAQWLLNTGFTEIPVTLDEFEAAFRAFRNDDPDGNGQRDTYPMTAPGNREDAPKGFFDEFFGAFGTFPYEWVEKDGKLVYGFTDPGTKEALALLAGWYAEELIDPEWVTEIARKDGENDVSWKFANDKIGYVSTLGAGDNQWDGNGHLNRKWAQFREDQWPYIWTQKCRPEPGCEAEMWLHEHLGFKEIDASAHPGYHPYVNGEPPVGPRGDAGMPVRGLVPVYIAFGRQLEREQPKYIRLLQVLDEIASNLDTYFEAGKGRRVFPDFETWVWIEWDKGPLFRYNQWTPYRLQNIDNYFGDYSGGNAMNPFWGFHWWYEPANGPAGLQRMRTVEHIASSGTVERPLKLPLPSAVEYADLDKSLNEFFYRVILGQQSVEDWDSVVATWQSNGGDVLTQEANEMFAGMK